MAFSQYISNVTDGIVDGVRKLEDLGVGAVLVNLLPPLGCAPLNTRADNYTRCEKDKITGVHNKNLMHKLRDDDSVLLLDLDTVFKGIVTPKTGKKKKTCAATNDRTNVILKSHTNDVICFQLDHHRREAVLP